MFTAVWYFKHVTSSPPSFPFKQVHRVNSVGGKTDLKTCQLQLPRYAGGSAVLLKQTHQYTPAIASWVALLMPVTLESTHLSVQHSPLCYRDTTALMHPAHAILHWEGCITQGHSKKVQVPITIVWLQKWNHTWYRLTLAANALHLGIDTEISSHAWRFWNTCQHPNCQWLHQFLLEKTNLAYHISDSCTTNTHLYSTESCINAPCATCHWSSHQQCPNSAVQVAALACQLSINNQHTGKSCQSTWS